MGSAFKGPKVKQPKLTPYQIKQRRLQNQVLAQLGKKRTVDAGGLKGTVDKYGRVVDVRSSAERDRLVNSLSAVFNRGAGEYEDLRDMVRPGFSALRDSQLLQVENARKRAMSDLKNDLTLRGVAGSSFAGDTQTRQEISFLEEKQRIEAVTFIQEMEMTSNFIDKQYQMESQALGVKLNELNIQAEMGLKLAGVGADLLKTQASLQTELAAYNEKFRTDIAIAQAELDAKASAGTGSFIGKGIGAIAGLAMAPATGGASLLSIPSVLGGSA